MNLVLQLLVLVSQTEGDLAVPQSSGGIFLEVVRAINDYGSAAFTGIAIAGVAYLFRELRSLNDKRFEEAKKLNEEHRLTLEKVIPAIAAQNASNVAIEKALKEQADADRTVHMDLQKLQSDVQNLTKQVDRIESRLDERAP